MSRFVLAVSVAAAIGATAPSPVAADRHEKPTVFTILAAAEPQTQLMAMTLTFQALQQGAKVRLLLCGPAGDIALKQPPASATAAQKPAGTSPHGMLGKLVEAGVPVDVCATYLPNRDTTPEALIPGVGQARPDVMAGYLIAPDTRILSF